MFDSNGTIRNAQATAQTPPRAIRARIDCTGTTCGACPARIRRAARRSGSTPVRSRDRAEPTAGVVRRTATPAHRVPAAPAWIPVLALAIATAVAAGVAAAAGSPAVALVSFRVVADGIPEPLAAGPGNAERGRALIVARDAANCVLCHALPAAAVRVAGDLGPSLAGIGARLTTPQLRLRVADNRRINPATIMPSYFRIDGLDRVLPVYRGRPILSAPEIEDVVAYLAMLR
jgi:sulfur-oxidizing protein SoxX